MADDSDWLIAPDSAQACAAVGMRDERLDLVADIAEDLLTVDGDVDLIVRRAYARLARHLGLEVYVNYLVDHERARLRLQTCAGIDPVDVQRLQWLNFGEAVCGTVARDRRRIVVEDVQESADPLTEFIRALGIRAYACQVLESRGRTIGTLSFGTRERDTFAPDELALLQTVSNLIASAFDRAALLEGLEHRARALDDVASVQASLLNSMSQAVIATDPGGRVTAWNARAEELYGWRREEALGKHIYELTVPEPQGEEARRIMAELASGERWSGEFTVSRRDGTTFIARVSNAPIRDEAGNTTGVIGLSEDITAEREKQAVEREEQQQRAEWLTFASHEFRNALTTIVGYSSRLRRRARTDEHLAPVREEIELLSAEARRIERSTELVMKVAALDMGHVHIDQEPLDLTDVIRDEIDALAHREAEVRVETKGLNDSLSVESDESAIRLILRNLMENAVKYGGNPAIVTVEAVGDDRGVRIAVSDNGQGIAEEDVPHIFDRYFRGARGSSGTRGLGLGLHISQRLSALLGGSLVVENTPGVGARFQLTVPCRSRC